MGAKAIEASFQGALFTCVPRILHALLGFVFKDLEGWKKAHHFERLFATYVSYILLVILTKNRSPMSFVHSFQYLLSYF